MTSPHELSARELLDSINERGTYISPDHRVVIEGCDTSTTDGTTPRVTDILAKTLGERDRARDLAARLETELADRDALAKFDADQLVDHLARVATHLTVEKWQQLDPKYQRFFRDRARAELAAEAVMLP